MTECIMLDLAFFSVSFTCPLNASNDNNEVSALWDVVVVDENDECEDCECARGFIADNESVCKPSEFII